MGLLHTIFSDDSPRTATTKGLRTWSARSTCQSRYSKTIKCKFIAKGGVREYTFRKAAERRERVGIKGRMGDEGEDEAKQEEKTGDEMAVR